MDAFCKHALNSMTVMTSGTSSREVGMALYPVDGALINHADIPNCWTLFEKEQEIGARDNKTEGLSYTLVVRCIAPIAEGEEMNSMRFPI